MDNRIISFKRKNAARTRRLDRTIRGRKVPGTLGLSQREISRGFVAIARTEISAPGGRLSVYQHTLVRSPTVAHAAAEITVRVTTFFLFASFVCRILGQVNRPPRKIESLPITFSFYGSIRELLLFIATRYFDWSISSPLYAPLKLQPGTR